MIFSGGQFTLWKNCVSRLCLGLEAEYDAYGKNDNLEFCSHFFVFFSVLLFVTCSQFDVTDTVFLGFGSGLLERMRQTLCFQPIVKVVDPVIARFTLFAHTPAMAAGAIDVEFRFVSSGFQRVVEGNDLGGRRDCRLAPSP